MEILVIGGTRYFGIPMVKRLTENGHSVTIATRGLHEVPFDNVSHITMDRTDGESVKKALGGRSFDVIIDKTAYSSNDVRALLEHARCGRYILMSSCAVYRGEHLSVTEEEFDPAGQKLVWADRTPDYAEGKRLAERAALEYLDNSRCTLVRYPVVLGENDYTGRLRFYAEHILNGTPVRLDGAEFGTSYISENEAGWFLAYLAGLADHPAAGAVNGCSRGIISQNEMIGYLEEKTGRRLTISPDGDPAPFNGLSADVSYSCARAEAAGWRFSELSEWVYGLLDAYLQQKKGHDL